MDLEEIVDTLLPITKHLMVKMMGFGIGKSPMINESLDYLQLRLRVWERMIIRPSRWKHFRIFRRKTLQFLTRRYKIMKLPPKRTIVE